MTRKHRILKCLNSLAGAGLLAVPLVVSPVGITTIVADDGWNPFKEQDSVRKPQRRREPRPVQSQPVETDNRPYLPPMDGRVPNVGTNASADQRFVPGQRYPSQRNPGQANPRTAYPGQNNPQYQSGPQPYRPPAYTPPASSSNGQFGSAIPQVERGELAPVLSENSGLPVAMWQGMDAATVEQLIGPLQLPSKSMELESIWSRLMQPDGDARQPVNLTAIQAEALYRSGKLRAASKVLEQRPGQKADPVLAALRARVEIVLGNTEAGCSAVAQAGKRKSKLPRRLRGEIAVLVGYCAAANGNRSAAGLAAELAREERYRSKFTLAVLESIATGRRAKRVLPKKVTALDYLLLKKAGFKQAGRLVKQATPALLAVLARDKGLKSDVRIAAAEEAAKRNVISAKDLASAYRSYEAGNSSKAPSDGLRRAEQFQIIESVPTPLRRTRAIRALIDSARRADMAMPVMVAVKPYVDEIRPAQEISWFAFTAIEVSLAASDYNSILPWLALTQASDRVYPEPLTHWQVLADISNPKRSTGDTNLYPLERLMARNQLSGPALHRLATVLDALDYNVPLPVWDAANRAPKPKTGQLPPTGVLTQLQRASKKKEAVRTVLLVMRTMGQDHPRDVHLIALGDSIRALKRAGLLSEAKRLAFEAMFDFWPRPSGY
ncbi:MAG: hypothetical protein AAGB04_19865 [Pseudomonadota bacterium]